MVLAAAIPGRAGDTMGKMLGSASRARELQKLFEAWRRACDRQDAEAMAAAKRAIAASLAGRTSRGAGAKTFDNGDI